MGAFQGSVFGADWKEAAQKAALAASRAVGEAEGLNVRVIEVPTIMEAYERMTGRGVP